MMCISRGIYPVVVVQTEKLENQLISYYHATLETNHHAYFARLTRSAGDELGEISRVRPKYRKLPGL